MGKSCKEVAQSLIDCMKKTECVRQGGEMRPCMKKAYAEGECTVSLMPLKRIVIFLNSEFEIKELMNAYFTCRRSGLDMRTRIQGPKVY